MRLPHAEDLAHLSDADRFKEVMKRLVSVTPEEFAVRETLEAEAALAQGKRKPGPPKGTVPTHKRRAAPESESESSPCALEAAIVPTPAADPPGEDPPSQPVPTSDEDTAGI